MWGQGQRAQRSSMQRGAPGMGLVLGAGCNDIRAGWSSVALRGVAPAGVSWSVCGAGSCPDQRLAIAGQIRSSRNDRGGTKLGRNDPYDNTSAIHCASITSALRLAHALNARH
jgi:hypothetical protein